MINEPVSISFASKHRVTFIKNTRQTHLGKLADLLLLTDLHKKLICPTTAGNVVNEAGEGSKTSAQQALYPSQLLLWHTGTTCTLTWQGCLHGHPPPPCWTPLGQGFRCLPWEKPQDARYWSLMDAVIWDRRGTVQIWEFAGSGLSLVRSLGTINN